MRVRVHHPLQQGLRRRQGVPYRNPKRTVRVHHPLQQGLRPFRHLRYDRTCTGTSASSITTRIKTVGFIDQYLPRPPVRVHHPLQQGLRLKFFK